MTSHLEIEPTPGTRAPHTATKMGAVGVAGVVEDAAGAAAVVVNPPEVRRRRGGDPTCPHRRPVI
jgi:hypothetical protein